MNTQGNIAGTPLSQGGLKVKPKSCIAALKRLSIQLLFLALVLGLSRPVWGQFTTAQLNGTITDSAGLALVGASVEAEQTETAYKVAVSSGPAGEFVFPSLPVGTYRLTVRITGFSTYQQTGIVLATSQNVTVSVHMTVGS